MSVEPQSCLSPDTVVAFLSGELDREQAAVLESHVDGCPDCLALVAALGKSPLCQHDDGGNDDPSTDEGVITGDAIAMPRTLVRGDEVGRYVVTGDLGAGGMGVVYAGYDPQLDRRIALKLLRTEGQPDARERLLREARALARLSHRNVVAVYDVGTHDDQIYLAMELIEGMTLRRWLTHEPRSWREIVQMYVYAGRGVDAAHRAGLVHRDFKPTNVLVADSGRVIVLDFGLARGTHEPQSAAIVEAGLAGEGVRTLTHGRAAVGTPAYMSPEQRRSDVVDARSDQYAFCVALFEAVYGAHPLLRPGAEDFAAQILDPPGRSAAPRSLRRILEQGLASDPDDRHRDMPRLLGALERVLRRRRRRAFAAAGVVVAVVATAAGWARFDDPCADAAADVADVWSTARRQVVDTALRDVDVAHASKTASFVSSRIDGWLAAWSDERIAACRATRVHGDQSARELQLRAACLDRSLAELDALADVLVHATADVANRAMQAVEELPDPRRCAIEARTEIEDLPGDPTQRERIAAMRASLGRVEALERSGRSTEALELGRRLADDLQGIEHAPTLAAIWVVYGTVAMHAGDYATAEDALYRGLWAAEDGRDDLLVARAWNQLAWLHGTIQSQLNVARRAAEHATAALQRAGGDDALEIQRLRNLGWAELTAGEPQRAVELFEQALRRAEPVEAKQAVLGPDHSGLITTVANLGMALIDAERFAEAREHLQRARDIAVASVGPDHPDLVAIHEALATADEGLGDVTRAREQLLAALQIADAAGSDRAVAIQKRLAELAP